MSHQPIYQHPLAYLLGLEGVALMRAFAGEHDRAFTEARFAEIRSLLDRADEFGPGVDVAPMPTPLGYNGWARTYDGEDNGASAGHLRSASEDRVRRRSSTTHRRPTS